MDKDEAIFALSLRVSRLERALKFTCDYVGRDLLPPLPGWDWWEALGCDHCKEVTMFWRDGHVECVICGRIQLS
jgi:hypothetical protein